mmetsp:Transcript_85185/g.227216  ORF Transcript_85185/g.227216 Transcript_85185/m.227216 type:complete len:219 (+) Transcript_85185:186-842(+)
MSVSTSRPSSPRPPSLLTYARSSAVSWCSEHSSMSVHAPRSPSSPLTSSLSRSGNRPCPMSALWTPTWCAMPSGLAISRISLRKRKPLRRSSSPSGPSPSPLQRAKRAASRSGSVSTCPRISTYRASPIPVGGPWRSGYAITLGSCATRVRFPGPQPCSRAAGGVDNHTRIGGRVGHETAVRAERRGCNAGGVPCWPSSCRAAWPGSHRRCTGPSRRP